MMITAKSLLWAVAGTAASLAAGYAAFIVFGFILGPGFDIDDKGTPIQKFFGAAALPALYVIPFIGTSASWAIAFSAFRRQ